MKKFLFFITSFVLFFSQVHANNHYLDIRKIKKSDKVIADLKPDWINSQGQFVDRVRYNFEGTRNSSSQGLCLVCYNKLLKLKIKFFHI